MDTFTEAYVDCALWSTNDDNGEPLDDNYGYGDIDPDTLAEMAADCKRFQEENADDIATFEHPQYCADEMAGHDFWLTRNGHGTGFWDGDWEEEVGNRLDKACEAYTDYNLYVGDNGRIYSL